MAHELRIKNGVAVRRDYADHGVGNVVRARIRDAVGAGNRPDGNSPYNEGFSFTQDEYDLLKKIRPHLFDQSLDPKTRLDHWKHFANSSEGRMFRVK